MARLFALALLLAALPGLVLADRPLLQAEYSVTNVVVTGALWEVSGQVADWTVLGYTAADVRTNDLVIFESTLGDIDAYRVAIIQSQTVSYLRATIAYVQDGSPAADPAPSVAALCAMATNAASTNVPLQPSLAGARISEYLANGVRNWALTRILATSAAGGATNVGGIHVEWGYASTGNAYVVDATNLFLTFPTNAPGGAGTTNASGIVFRHSPTNYPTNTATGVEGALAGIDAALAGKLGSYTNLHTGAGTTGGVTSTSADAANFYRGDGSWQPISQFYFAPLWRAFAAGSAITNMALDIFRAAEGEPLLTGAVVGEADKRFYLLRNGRPVWRDGSGSWGLHMTVDVANVTVTFEQESAAGPVTIKAADFAQVGVTGGVSPVGSIIMFGATNAPAGWLTCNGAAVSRTTYARLYAIVGNTWGAGDGSTTFNVPDLRERMPWGHSAGTNLLAAAGGAKTVVLTTNEMPAHAHDLPMFEPLDTAGNVTRPQGWGRDSVGTRANGVNSTGGGAAHENMPPYRTVNFIIKH